MATKTTPSSWYAYRERKEWTNLVGEPTQWTRVSVKQQSFTGTVSYGTDLADWKRRIRRSENATTILSGTKVTNTLCTDGYVYLKWINNIGVTSFREIRGALIDLDLASTVVASSFSMASVRNKVIQDINSQIRAGSKSLQGLVSLGEMGESVRMVNSLGRDLFLRTDDYLRDLNKVARSLTPRNLLRTVSERWLEYRFGIKPLLSDISGFVDACYQNRFGRPPVIKLRASSKSTEKNPTTITSIAHSNILITTKKEISQTYGMRLYGAMGLYPGQTIPPFSQEFGLTLDEFVPTLYELIPFSFLVDYVSNLGAIIDAYSLNKSNLHWLAIGEVREGECKLSGSITNLAAGPGITMISEVIRPCTPLRRIWRQVDRAPYTGPLIPSLEFRIPGTETRWLNIAALSYLHADTSQRLRSRLRL